VRVSMPWFRPAAMGLAILLALTCAAPLATAGERGATASSSLAAQAAASVANHKPTPRALMAQAGGATTTPASGSTESRSFFSTPTGIAAAVLMVAGAGFVAISIHRDNTKVHSPIR